MTKNTPKKPAVTVSAMSLPASCFGHSLSRCSRYMAGTALTKRIPIPPAAVAALWTVQFSFGPKGPPKRRPRMPDSGSAFDKGLIIAKPKMA